MLIHSKAAITTSLKSMLMPPRLRSGGNLGFAARRMGFAPLNPSYRRGASQPQRRLGRRVLHLHRLRYPAVGDVAVVDIETAAQMRVLAESAARAVLRQREHKRQRHVVEREG